MKKHLLLIAICIPAMIKAQGINYTINGTVGNLGAPAKAYLSYRTISGGFMDSTNVENGSFSFKGTFTNPVKATLTLSATGTSIYRLRKKDQLPLYLEAATIQISATDSISKATVTGSPSTKDYHELIVATKPYVDQVNAIEALLLSGRRMKETPAELEKKIDAVNEQQKPVLVAFIKSHPNSLVSIDALRTYGSYFPEVLLVEPLYNSLSANVKNSVTGLQYATLLNGWKSTEIGSKAPLFSQNDKDGNPISLASFKGKYVLVDFWASWCGPCREANPGLLKAFNQFKDKNFAILGISLDRQKGPWLKAIADDHLPWLQLSDLKYTNNEVALLYGAKAIPQNFLLDQTGRIIAKNLDGPALETKLGQIFNSGSASTSTKTDGK